MSTQALSAPNLSRSELPAITLTDAISVADLSNQYRERFFLDDISTVEYLNSYDSVVMRFLDLVGNGGVSATSPKIEWTEVSRLETASPLEVAINSSAEYIKLEDPGIANVGQLLFVVGGEVMVVRERSLTNGLSGSTNLRVYRAQQGTTATAHAAGTSFIAGPALMGEKDVPMKGTGTMPGLSQYNFGCLVGRTYDVTRLNQNTVIRGGWGQLEMERAMNMYALRRECGQMAMWGKRWVEDAGTRGPLYQSGGLDYFIKSNVLQLENDPSRHTWEILDSFFYNLFNFDASSNQKIALVGRDLFFAHKKLAREMGRYDEVASDAAKLGEQSYVFNSDYGVIRYELADHDLPSNPKYNLGEFGFFIDPANVVSGNLAGFSPIGGFELIPDIQEKRQGITLREDAVVGSFWLAPKFEQTHGIIRGAPKATIVSRAETL